jgi:hypothetical protein
MCPRAYQWRRFDIVSGRNVLSCQPVRVVHDAKVVAHDLSALELTQVLVLGQITIARAVARVVSVLAVPVNHVRSMPIAREDRQSRGVVSDNFGAAGVSGSAEVCVELGEGHVLFWMPRLVNALQVSAAVVPSRSD